MTFNMMTCSSSDGSWIMGAILGDCSLAWFSFAIIIFLALMLRRQATDGFLAGTGYNIFGAFIVGLGANILITFLFGSARWSLIGGVLGLVVGGFGIGYFLDTAGGSE